MVIVEKAPIVDLEHHLIRDPKYRGGHIPTYTGMSHSPGWSEKMRLKFKGREKSPNEIEKRSTVWNIVRKILERDRTIPYSEIADITSFTLQQVENTVHNHYRNPKSFYPIEPFTKKERKKRRKRAAANLSISQRPPISQKEREDRQFAGLLLRSPLITNDPVIWNTLRKSSVARHLPKGFARKIILEAFIIALSQAQKGNTEPMDKYLTLGRSINPGRFFSETKGKTSSSLPIDIDYISKWSDTLDKIRREEQKALLELSRR